MFPNTIIAYRILLTIRVTIASVLKLELLKFYLRSTISQERFNDLSLITIENDLLETIQYKDLVDEFVLKSVRKMTLFK